MATFPTGTLSQRTTIGLREDLADAIYNMSPTDTPLMSAIPTTSAQGVKHEWQTDALAAASSANLVIEGLDASTDSATVTVRLYNYTQILDKVPRVTGTNEAVLAAGRGSEMEYQIVKRAKELKRDIETTLFLNQITTDGAASTARALGGLQTWIITNLSEGAGASTATGKGLDLRTAGTGRAFTESQLQEVIREAFNSGGDPDTIHTDAFNKQKFSTFTGNATRFKGAEDKALYAAIDIYDSDFGELQVIPNRFCKTANSTVGAAYVLQTDMLAIAYLRPFRLVDLAKTGDSEHKQLITELTLECRNELAHGIVHDLTIA